MKKFTLKALLMAAALGMGGNAWADGTKRVLKSENYETATASDWTCPNGSAVLKEGDAIYGKYAQCYPSGSGNRSCYKSVTFGYEAGSGYTTADMATAGYNIEFDFVLVGGNVVERSVSQFIVPTTGPNLATNNAYTGTDYIFALTQPSLAAEGANEGKGGGSTGTAVTTWYINDLTNATTTTIELDGSIWYHLKLVVTASSVKYTITNNSTSVDVATGTKTVSALPTITGFFDLLGRGSGKINFDNLDIYDYTEGVTVTAPTFTFKKVDGANRVYTLANPNGSGTLYYTTSPANEAPAVGNAAYTSTTETSIDVPYSESGTYYAYVLHSNGETTSAVVSQAVTAGALTLTAPAFTVTDLVQGADGFYYPQVTFASNNSSLEGKPTATYDVASPYTFTSTGSITVTASAEGYTSSSSTFTVEKPYVKSKTIDFGAMTASDFDTNIWTSATGAPRDYWTNRAAKIPADVTYYKLKNTSSTQGDPDNSAVLDGITISNYHQRTPEVYIGYGLLTPYAAISGSSNNMNFTVNGATAEDYVVYNGWNNYGSGTFNTVLAGNATFALYRYDTMLRTINVYSPAPATVSASITSAGYSTYCSPYALDLDNISGGTAFYASAANESSVTLTQATGPVAAGTGLILKGVAEATVTIPVAASGDAIDGNLLVGCPTATTINNLTDGYANFYVFSVEDAEFQNLKAYIDAGNSVTIPAGKAYLNAAAGLTAKLRVIFESEDATAITAIEATEAINNGVIYNLSGQRVVKPLKGIYIQNGKKILVK